MGVGFSIIFFLFLSLTIFSIYEMENLSSQTIQIYDHPLTVSNAVLRINWNITKIHQAMKDIVIARTPEVIEKEHVFINNLENEILNDFKIIEQRFLGEKEKYIAAFNIFEEWRLIHHELLDLTKRGLWAEATKLITGKGAIYVVNLENAMGALHNFAESKAVEFRDRSLEIRKNALFAIYLLLGLVSVVTISLAIGLTLSIKRPLSKVQTAMERIGTGDLDSRIVLENRDEIGDLARSFNQMASALKRITTSRDKLNREIAERKQTERKLEQLNEEIRQKNRELEQIVFITSHDLRSPLVNIQGFSQEFYFSLNEIQNILNELELEPEKRKKLTQEVEECQTSLDFIRKSVEKMGLLMGGLLQFSRSGRVNMTKEILDMNQLITAVLQGFEFRIHQKGIKIELQDLPACIGDKTLLVQLFSNLIDNALKYQNREREGEIIISGTTKADQSIYQIKDNGIGISPEYYEKIFDIFHKLNQNSKGEGLGLSIVHRIIERHNGKIWVESVEGEGTTFFVALPR